MEGHSGARRRQPPSAATRPTRTSSCSPETDPGYRPPPDRTRPIPTPDQLCERYLGRPSGSSVSTLSRLARCRPLDARQRRYLAAERCIRVLIAQCLYRNAWPWTARPRTSRPTRSRSGYGCGAGTGRPWSYIRRLRVRLTSMSRSRSAVGSQAVGDGKPIFGWPTVRWRWL